MTQTDKEEVNLFDGVDQTYDGGYTVQVLVSFEEIENHALYQMMLDGEPSGYYMLQHEGEVIILKVEQELG